MCYMMRTERICLIPKLVTSVLLCLRVNGQDQQSWPQKCLITRGSEASVPAEMLVESKWNIIWMMEVRDEKYQLPPTLSLLAAVLLAIASH